MLKANFERDLERGKVWESEVCQILGLHRTLNEKGPDLAFRHPMHGTIFVEVKTDQTAERTGNLFFEKHSDSRNPNSLGGPWRAQRERVGVMVYYLPDTKRIFRFWVEPLIEYLEEGNFRIALGPPHEGKEDFRSSGLVVPIAAITKRFPSALRVE